jgi:hypothetical protein
MTPPARKAAALEEDRRTGAGTVVKRKALNVGNGAMKGI